MLVTFEKGIGAIKVGWKPFSTNNIQSKESLKTTISSKKSTLKHLRTPEDDDSDSDDDFSDDSEPETQVQIGGIDSFLNEIKSLDARDMSDIGQALRTAFDYLNQHRLPFNYDSYGEGRLPFRIEPAMLLLIHDSGQLTTYPNGDIADQVT